MTPRRAAWLGGAVALTLAGLAFVGSAPADVQVGGLSMPTSLVLVLVFATPFAVAAGLLAGRVAAVAQGGDGAERFLALTTAGLRTEWGTAMRAELGSLTDPIERRRFARSAGLAALRVRGSVEWLVAMGVTAGLGVLAVLFSRLVAGIDSDIDPLAGLLLGLVRALALLAVALAVALLARSMRAGLEVGTLALLGTVACAFVVIAIEAMAGAGTPGTTAPPTAAAAAGSALSPLVVWLHLVWLAPWPVLGAALGARLARRGGHPVPD